MSTKKKRPSPIMPTRAGYDMVKTLGTVDGGYGSDELDNTMRQVQKMQTDKLKSTMIQKTQLEMEKEVKQLKKDMDSLGSGGGGGASITSEDVQFLSQLPDEQRATAIQAMAAFKSQSGGGNATGSLGPLLIMSMLQKQPQAGVTELVSALKGLNDIVQTGKPKESGDVNLLLSVAKMLGDAKDMAYSTQITLLQKQIEDIKPHDPLEYQKNLIDIAKGLGFQPGGGVNTEVEKMKMENDRYLQKSAQEFEMMKKKWDRDDKRVEDLLNMLTEVAKPFAERAGAALPGLLGGVAGASLAQKQPPVQQGGPLSVKCPCGYEPIWVSEDTPVIACPNCGQSVTHPAFKDKTGAQPPGNVPPFSPDSNAPPPPG